MALPPGSPPLNRDNAIPLLLGAFSSNDVLKAMIFLPAVSDDFYLFNRAKPQLNIKAGNLFEAVTALTNATGLRATFRERFLLLHMDRDVLEPACLIRDAARAAQLKRVSHLRHARFSDMHWEKLQPVLQKTATIEVRPPAQSEDAWHFSRHNLAGWNLTDWELLNAVSLAGNTVCTVQKERLVFQQRPGP